MGKSEKEDVLEEIMIEHGSELVRLAFNYVKDKEAASQVLIYV